MPFQEGRNRVTITQVEMIKLKEKEGDNNRYSIVVTGQLEDGSTMDGWMFLSKKVGKDGKSSYKRNMEILTSIGLPGGNIMELNKLVGQDCSFTCEFDQSDAGDDYGSQLRVQFINPVRKSCSQDEIAKAMAFFTGNEPEQQVPREIPPHMQRPANLAPPTFNPPVQNTAPVPQPAQYQPQQQPMASGQ